MTREGVSPDHEDPKERQRCLNNWLKGDKTAAVSALKACFAVYPIDETMFAADTAATDVFAHRQRRDVLGKAHNVSTTNDNVQKIQQNHRDELMVSGTQLLPVGATTELGVTAYMHIPFDKAPIYVEADKVPKETWDVIGKLLEGVPRLPTRNTIGYVPKDQSDSIREKFWRAEAKSSAHQAKDMVPEGTEADPVLPRDDVEAQSRGAGAALEAGATGKAQATGSPAPAGAGEEGGSGPLHSGIKVTDLEEYEARIIHCKTMPAKGSFLWETQFAPRYIQQLMYKTEASLFTHVRLDVRPQRFAVSSGV